MQTHYTDNILILKLDNTRSIQSNIEVRIIKFVKLNFLHCTTIVLSLASSIIYSIYKTNGSTIVERKQHEGSGRVHTSS